MAKQSQEAEAVKTTKGSLKQSYEVPAGEEGLCHVIMTDYSSPRPKDLTEDYQPRETILKLDPHNFVMMFGPHMAGGDNLQKMTTPGRIVRVAKNIDKKLIQEIYEGRISEATVGKNSKEKSVFIDRLLKGHKQLRVAGGAQVVKPGNVLHIPTNREDFPFDPEDIGKFPSECLWT
jgi:hypothetical protein